MCAGRGVSGRDRRPLGRLPALARHAFDARDGRHHGDSRCADRHRPGGLVEGQPAVGDRRHRHSRDSAGDPSGALAGAIDPRRTLRRGGDLAGHADLEDHVRSHPAQHAGAADRAGHLHLRVGDPDRGDPVIPGIGSADRHSDLGQHHGRGPGAVPAVPAQRVFSRHLSGADGAGGQHTGRWPARRA